MGRPTKQGIDYFPLDVGFFTDLKIRKISRACGSQSTSILICLLCNIYRNNGYYIVWDKDMPFVIADEIGVTEDAVSQVVIKAVQVGFFNEELYEKFGILTSETIQRRWLKITDYVDRKLFNQYSLLEEDIKIPMYKLSDAPVRLNVVNARLWRMISLEVFERDNYTCQYCGQIGGLLEVDHVVPFSKGGSDSVDNLITACRHCNRQKRDKSVEEFLLWRENHEF